MKIKKGDKVVVIAGKQKGETGIVKEILPNKNRVIVEEINILTKHIKPSQTNPDGGIEKIEGSIHASNVMVVVEETKDKIVASRIKYNIKVNKNGKKDKTRVSVKTGMEL